MCPYARGYVVGMRTFWKTAPLAALGAVAAHDLLQRKHAILRNFPVLGHARYWLETIGPELRQYIVASNDEERPFSRDQRRWVYASSKLQNNYFGFGTDNDLEHTDGNVIVHHRTFGRAFPTHGSSGRRRSCRRRRSSAVRAVVGTRSGRPRSSTSPG